MLKDEEIQLVRQSVTMRDIAGMYGYKVTRSGFMVCPFHADHDPSMKVYDGDRGFNCFVCHTGGDIIHFVRLHDNLEFEPAVRMIARHFGIPISDGKEPLSETDRKRIADQRAKREAAENARKADQERLTEVTRKLHRLKDIQAEFEPLGPVWCRCQRDIEKLEREWDYLFEKET
jgi:DNA primase